MPTTAKNSLQIVVSKDRLRAHLHLVNADAEAVTADAILARARELAIPVTNQLTARVNELVESVKARGIPVEPVLLVEGHGPVNGTAASFQPAVSNEAAHGEESGDERVDFHRSRIVTANEGAAIGRLEPQVAAVPGEDVFGKPIPGAAPSDSVRLGENVLLAEDGKTVIATVSGKVHLARNFLSVLKVVEIAEDVDFSSGNLDAPTDVLIKGTVRETFAVRSAKSVTVKGAVEAAMVEAGTDVHVNGGIIARHEGKVIAGGEICAKFCEEADLHAGGDITIIREAMNSRIHTASRLLVPRGKVIGGYSYAREGAEIKVLGNEVNVRTKIAIGLDPIALAEASRTDKIIEKKKQAAAKIREKVQPLMAQLKRLTAQQRERATELMYEADQMDMEVQEHEKNKKAALAAKSPTGEAALLITGTLYPGVVIIFGNKMTPIDKERRGPVKIVRRLVDRVLEMVMADQVSGSVHTLPSYEYTPEPEPAEVTA